jgi:GMP synthase-like glutamine amidotransferase
VKIGLLQCDHVAAELAPRFGDQPTFFQNLFAKHAPEITLDVFDIQAGKYPANPNQYDGFIGTGAKYSVTENLPWIKRFKEYVYYLYQQKMKFIGICFGHQMIAHALGGRCDVSERGWGLGVQKIHIHKKKSWMQPEVDAISLLYSHMDQIITLPQGSEVLAGNDHCPYAIITVDDHFIGIQAHPEFTPAYLDLLMQSRVDRIGAEKVAAAQKTLAEKIDENIVARWMVNFFLKHE